jgi:hypothetical protein
MYKKTRTGNKKVKTPFATNQNFSKEANIQLMIAESHFAPSSMDTIKVLG